MPWISLLQRSLMLKPLRNIPSRSPIENMVWRISSNNGTPMSRLSLLPLTDSNNAVAARATAYASGGTCHHSVPENSSAIVNANPINGRNSWKLNRLPCLFRVLVLQKPYRLHIRTKSRRLLRFTIWNTLASERHNPQPFLINLILISESWLVGYFSSHPSTSRRASLR